MSEKRIGIIMHGVTGRMGMNQHLIRSILAIRKQGGVALRNGDRIMPDPLLVGRNAAKVEELAKKHGLERWTADLAGALKSKDDTVFFDAASTQLRPKLLKQAIAAGKHIYCEKPTATTTGAAYELYQAAKKRWGVSAQYSFSKRYAVYLSIVDLTGYVQDLRRYAPGTPDYMKAQRYQELGSTIMLGVKGSF